MCYLKTPSSYLEIYPTRRAVDIEKYSYLNEVQTLVFLRLEHLSNDELSGEDENINIIAKHVEDILHTIQRENKVRMLPLTCVASLVFLARMDMWTDSIWVYGVSNPPVQSGERRVLFFSRTGRVQVMFVLRGGLNRVARRALLGVEQSVVRGLRRLLIG